MQHSIYSECSICMWLYATIDKEPDACLHRLAIANEYLDFLSVATTDDT